MPKKAIRSRGILPYIGMVEETKSFALLFGVGSHSTFICSTRVSYFSSNLSYPRGMLGPRTQGVKLGARLLNEAKAQDGQVMI